VMQRQKPWRGGVRYGYFLQTEDSVSEVQQCVDVRPCLFSCRAKWLLLTKHAESVACSMSMCRGLHVG
jgi:hypothetical protein